MSISVEDVVVVDGVRREVYELFRASGVQWVRYKEPDGSNRYATELEWLKWTHGIFTE